MVTNTVKIVHLFFMVLSEKSITEAQLHGYNHKTTSKVCCTYISPLYVLVLLPIDFPLKLFDILHSDTKTFIFFLGYF